MKSVSILILMFCSLYASAQSFDKNMDVLSESRVIKCYKPSGFDAAPSKSLLIAMPGMPATNPASAQSFRNALIPVADEHPDMLVACPVASTSGNGFFALYAGDTLLLRRMIDSFTVEYGIDPANIYLAGFSANGFSTFLFAMHNFYPFKGVIPFNPALDDAYFQIPDMFPIYNPPSPVCLCSGTSDPTYQSSVRMKDSMSAHNANYLFNPMQGIGHTYNFPGFKDEMGKCFSFFNSVSGVHAVSESHIMNIYPNPASDRVIIRHDFNEKTIQARIISVEGKIIFQTVADGADQISLNISGIAPGYYTVQLLSSKGTSFGKLQVIR